MRNHGLTHLELSVLDYDRSIALYDWMFGWPGCEILLTLDIGYRSIYRVALWARHPVLAAWRSLAARRDLAR